MMRRRSLMVSGKPPIPNVAEVFAATLYTGNGGTTRALTTGVDLSAGGLAWFKRTDGNDDHYLIDTERGAAFHLRTNGRTPQTEDTSSPRNYLQSFDVNGVTVGETLNANNDDFEVLSFVETPRYLDTVTWTGNGTNPRAISHDLGIAPGVILAKSTTADNTDWEIYHRSLTDEIFNFNNTAAITHNNEFGVGATITAPIKDEFTVGSGLNASGVGYVAYLFGHDPIAGVVAAGSYTGNGSTTGPVVNVGFEPQFLMVKADANTNWLMFDATRDGANPRDKYLVPNAVSGEATGFGVDFTASGFQPKVTTSGINANAVQHYYLAIKASA